MNRASAFTHGHILIFFAIIGALAFGFLFSVFNGKTFRGSTRVKTPAGIIFFAADKGE